MSNDEKIKAIKAILGSEYDQVVILGSKKSENRDERNIQLIVANQGAIVAMVVNTLDQYPVATSLVKYVIGALKSDPLTDELAPLFFGGKKNE